MCCVCECYRGGILVMDVIWCRLCVNTMGKGGLFVLSWVELGGVVGVCEMCMCLARGGVGGEGVSG